MVKMLECSVPAAPVAGLPGLLLLPPTLNTSPVQSILTVSQLPTKETRICHVGTLKRKVPQYTACWSAEHSNVFVF